MDMVGTGFKETIILKGVKHMTINIKWFLIILLTIAAIFMAWFVYFKFPKHSEAWNNHCYSNCYTPSPTPTETPTPSPTPTETPNPCDEQEEYLVLKDVVDESPCPTESPSPTPTETPEITPLPVVYSGESDGLGCSTHDCSGNVNGNTSTVVVPKAAPNTGHGS